MLDIFNHLSPRESIIYFFVKFTNNKLNANHNIKNFYIKRNSDIVWNLINRYFENDPFLCNATLARKYFHIYHQNEKIGESKDFVNFNVGYRQNRKKNGIFKKDRQEYINSESIKKIKIYDIYPKEIIKEILKETKIKFRKIHTISDKKLIVSIYEHTNSYKKLPFHIRIKLLTGELTDSDVQCSVCKKEIKMNGRLITSYCGSDECLSEVYSKSAKKRGTWMMHTESAILNKKKALAGRKLSDEHKNKIGISNSKRWTSEYIKKDREYRLKLGCDKKISKTLKQKILNGEYTPKSENRKRASRIKSDITGIKYRSNWELIFHESNPELQYESIRIPYIENGIERVYITDFVDYKNKVIYEIKPTSELNDSNFLIKKKYTEEWCEINGFVYKVITEKDCNFYERK